MTLRELNDVCKKVLAEGCIRLGLIENEEEIGTYYMHSVSPVSYTHLDVYKRQEYIKGNGQKLAADGYFSDFISNGASTEICFTAVSYTHLLGLILHVMMIWRMMKIYPLEMVTHYLQCQELQLEKYLF